MVEYLDPEIANEGFHAEKHSTWMNSPDPSAEEWQPDIEPPHINDYAGFRKHKHYGKYFRPWRYSAFPAWVYHPTKEAKIVQNKEEVLALGPEWSPTPTKPRIDMTGKSTPVKSETQRLAEVVAQGLAAKQGSAPIDAGTIAAIVAAVMAATQPQAVKAVEVGEVVETEETSVERNALIELAERDGVKIDKRWGNDRIKKELGI